MAQSAGGVVQRRLLHLCALHQHRARLIGLVDRRHHQHVGLGGVGHPVHRARQLSVAVHSGCGGTAQPTLGVHRPLGVQVAGGSGGDEGRAPLAARPGRPAARRRRRVQQRGGRHVAQQGHRGQHPAALGGHQHRVQRAQPGAALLLGDHQAGPAGLARGVPQVEALAAVQRLAGRLQRLVARERAAGGLAQQLLLVGESEVHLLAPAVAAPAWSVPAPSAVAAPAPAAPAVAATVPS